MAAAIEKTANEHAQDRWETVTGLFLMKTAHLEQIMFWLFLAGNALYYIAGIALAFAFKDNRAFCKYLCPITVFLKPVSYFLCCAFTATRRSASIAASVCASAP